jgi:hypothetical protein
MRDRLYVRLLQAAERQVSRQLGANTNRYCEYSLHDHLILNGMMMSPPNVNCELFVPAPKGVVPFIDVS